MKLGSLFDGSGGFPLGGAMHGIEPVWASEIEEFPIRVTTLRFPNMKHLGDVTKINGAEIEPVDIITFGSPCQDLSVAGKQLGIHEGERSNLFFQAIRIIKEMRYATANEFPRYAVWENVPGAFSSNKGEDFRAVLRSLCSVCDDTADVPRPADGIWQPAGCVLGDGYSIAWRVYDAQYWGVPQRRKRIYALGSFTNERAGEILFKPESMCWNYQTRREARENASRYAKGSFDGSDWPCWWPRRD
jgi:DNA (cytosine-5)-methyltransferase 1